MAEEKECNCDKPEILAQNPEGCTLNQVIKCHGDEPFKVIIERSCGSGSGCGCGCGHGEAEKKA